MPSLSSRLEKLCENATAAPDRSIIGDREIQARIESVCRCLGNRAGVRLLMACMLGKIDQPHVDPRQPYTEIGGEECFSGRTIDERYLTAFIAANRIPCNSTTDFLTPALRNINTPLTKNVEIMGRPPQVYHDTLEILDRVASGRIEAVDVLSEIIRLLVVIREEGVARVEAQLSSLGKNTDGLPLSSEDIVTLIAQHLACKHASRLPVLVVAAAYDATSSKLGEFHRPLHGHLAADQQTGAIGDVEICLQNDDNVVTGYEMKMKPVTLEDIDRAITKIMAQAHRVDNYVFVTTDAIDAKVVEYAASMYERLGGTEIVILDCLGFLRHFIHFFHRSRMQFLEGYQKLLLAEPASAVRQPLKEAFLSLRQAAESDE